MNNQTQKQILGKLGEDIACKYLKSKGFSIIDRNYLKKCGEIDIIAKNKDIIHFVEVKSVSREINREIVSSETGYRPEDNLHPWKLERLTKTIQIYLIENNVSDETNWQFDVITVYIDEKKRISKVFMLENVIL
jgi:putative endonuclease